MSKPIGGDRIFTPKDSFVANIDGVDQTLVRGRDLVREGHDLLSRFPDMFEPVPVKFDVEDTTAEPGARRAR